MIYIGSDHAGFQLKERLKKILDERGLLYTDVGTDSEESCDFPDYAFSVAEKIGASSLSGGADLGILACGSGIGMAIAANKVKGARAALALNEYMGRQSREHDDANILVVAGRIMNEAESIAVTNAFLDASFIQEEKYIRRLNKIKQYEETHLT